MRVNSLAVLLLALPFALCAGSQESPPQLEGFVVNHELRANSAVAGVCFLLSAPAGRQGFIGVAGDHLVTPDGKRFRMWGVNMTGWIIGAE